MFDRSGGRRRFIMPRERENAEARLVLLILILVLCTALTLLFAWTGFHESFLSLALPANRLAVPTFKQPVMAAAIPHEPQLIVQNAERQYSSTETVSLGLSPQPQILIYHTHATEAYLQNAADGYEESGQWRTKDPEHSVIAVGNALKAELEERFGRGVLHDTGNYEPPKLSTSYSRSLEAMQAYKQQYSTLRIFIDVHRDAYGSSDVDNTEPKDFLIIDGQEVAKLMFVVGTGKGATGSGFDVVPDFDANFAFADALTHALNGMHTGLAREIRVKTGRYNQHVSTHCLLVEVGHNANTLEQALAAVPYLARAIDLVLGQEDMKAASAHGLSVWTPQEGENAG